LFLPFCLFVRLLIPFLLADGSDSEQGDASPTALGRAEKQQG
jgi:hypothetical protein